MLHYEVIHYFVRVIPVIKLLNAYPNADKTAQLRISVDLLYFKLESWGLPYLEALEVLIIAIITEEP